MYVVTIFLLVIIVLYFLSFIVYKIKQTRVWALTKILSLFFNLLTAAMKLACRRNVIKGSRRLRRKVFNADVTVLLSHSMGSSHVYSDATPPGDIVFRRSKPIASNLLTLLVTPPTRYNPCSSSPKSKIIQLQATRENHLHYQ